MPKKVIAVVPLWDDEKESIWMLPGYMNGIKEAGAIPVILPLTNGIENALEIFERCDGLLMTGGHDVSPSLYKEPRKENCGISCSDRDLLESALYAAAPAQDKPVLGICRGIQLINVLQGGTLYQDLPTEYASGIEHHMIKPSEEEKRDLYSLANNIPFDDRINHEAELSDLNITLIQSYLKEIGSSLYHESSNMDFVDLCRSMNIVNSLPEYTKGTSASEHDK